MNILEFVEIDSASICSMVPINSRKKIKPTKDMYTLNSCKIKNHQKLLNTKSVSDLDLVLIKGLGNRAILWVMFSIFVTWPTSIYSMKNIFWAIYAVF